MLKDNLKAFRETRGLSQEQLAQKLHVVRQTVSKWERGSSVPDADMVMALAQVPGPKRTLARWAACGGWHRASAKEKGQQTRRSSWAGNGPKTALACGWAKWFRLSPLPGWRFIGSYVHNSARRRGTGGRVPSKTRTQCLLRQCRRASALQNDAGFPAWKTPPPGGVPR